MRPSARLAVAAVASSFVLTACGSASEPSPPTGVDQLVIPSPSLDAADFVDRIDNPWLPLTAGSRWVYTSTTGGKDARVSVTVLDRTRRIDGVTATGVQTDVVRDDRVLEVTVDWYAQDADGNVWHLGEEGVWEAGVDGARAGLAMAAHPRVGDGYQQEYAEGVAEDRALVVALDGSASVPYGDLTDLLETEDSSPLVAGVVERRSYARGLGLVRVVTDDEGDERLALVAIVEG